MNALRACCNYTSAVVMGFVELILLFNCGDDKIKSDTVYGRGRFVAVTLAASCLPGHLLSLQEATDDGTFVGMSTAGSKPTSEGSLLEMQTPIGRSSQCQELLCKITSFVGKVG